jgi:hypothetical protein
MAAEATAANLAAQGTSAGASALTTTGVAIKAFILANPVALAGIAGIAIGAIGYSMLTRHDHDEGEACCEAEEAEAEKAAAS